MRVTEDGETIGAEREDLVERLLERRDRLNGRPKMDRR